MRYLSSYTREGWDSTPIFQMGRLRRKAVSKDTQSVSDGTGSEPWSESRTPTGLASDINNTAIVTAAAYYQPLYLTSPNPSAEVHVSPVWTGQAKVREIQ